METRAALAILGEYTAEQWGLVTAAQASAAGVDSVTLYRLKDAGFLAPIRRGVYAATAAPDAQFQDERAVWLALNPSVPAWQRSKLDRDGGVLSHGSAARLHGLGDLTAEVVTVTVPRRRSLRDPSVQVRRRQLTEQDVTLIDGLPTTTPLRTVQDLLDDHSDGSHLATIIRQGVQTGVLEPGGLVANVGAYARRYDIGNRDGERLVDYLLGHIGSSLATLTGRTTSTTRDAIARDQLIEEVLARLRPRSGEHPPPASAPQIDDEQPGSDWSTTGRENT
ncbi:hypothetical protein GCM10009676_09190 [Prauserella halophila]|uniref:AbiEi antitoxin N-terminal domain-containing protein n=1 Tax=Prauserella halophila TaxID=185641 RepID=A0ABP4GLD4_9PSEU|nr:type IV toxin-antitoxin system AbiEi family antitoxin domain-containing protein [Prauserella halophila]MCP2235275.1 Transcriptional regulator, AbiEi antitoxin, Type IV TA system [Prauserella halophila]